MKTQSIGRILSFLALSSIVVGCALMQPAAKPVPSRAEAPAPAPITHVPQALKPIPHGQSTEALAPSAIPPDQMVVHYIDVGQGDAELLEFSCAAVLVDTGGEKTQEVDGRDNLVAFLNAFFARRTDLQRHLKLAILSHPHIDHTYGVGTVQPGEGLLGMSDAVIIENVVDDGNAPSIATGAPGQNALHASAPHGHYFGVTAAAITTTVGLTNSIIDPVDCTSTGGLDPKISVLWGRVDPSVGSWVADENNNSVVVKVEFGAASFLFMGDLEQPGINAMLESYSADLSIFKSDVLKVGHHGSKNGTTQELLQAVKPKMAVIGAGDFTLSHATFSAYSFAHPNKIAIDLLSDNSFGVTLGRPSKTVSVGIKGADHKNHLPPVFQKMTLNRAIYATGWDGTVAVTAHSDGSLSVQPNQ